MPRERLWNTENHKGGIQAQAQEGGLRTYYFAYGSNLWIQQMNTRCPSNILIGTAILPAYRWVISSRGYANVLPSPPDDCYGVVYSLTDEDVRALDWYEGVPISYEKEMANVKMIDGETIPEALVYVDPKITEGVPRKEYITRINNGLEDAKDIPKDWVEKYIRPFVPAVPPRAVDSGAATERPQGLST